MRKILCLLGKALCHPVAFVQVLWERAHGKTTADYERAGRTLEEAEAYTAQLNAKRIAQEEDARVVTEVNELSDWYGNTIARVPGRTTDAHGPLSAIEEAEKDLADPVTNLCCVCGAVIRESQCWFHGQGVTCAGACRTLANEALEVRKTHSDLSWRKALVEAQRRLQNA